MVTSVSMRNATWMDGVQVNAQDLRLQAVSGRLTGASPSGSTGIASRPGVRYGTGDPLKVSAASGMNITVNAGFAYVQGTVSATSGMYEGCLDTTSTLTVTTSDPTNPRIDNVIVKFVDNGDNTSTGTVTIQPGTPAPSPVAPALPANSLLLATVAVGAGVSSIVAGNISEGRVYTVATGGILPMKDVTGGITGQAGLYAQDLSTGRLRVSDGSGNARQPKIAAFAPVNSAVSSFTVTSTSYQVITSASVTVDGATELDLTFTFGHIDVVTGTPAINDNLDLAFSLSNGVGGASWNSSGTNNDFFYFTRGLNQSSGGTLKAWITPNAGTVTIYMLSSLGQATTYAVRSANLRIQANVNA